MNTFYHRALRRWSYCCQGNIGLIVYYRQPLSGPLLIMLICSALFRTVTGPIVRL